MDDKKPEYNVTGQDFADRRHLTYAGPPIIDFHAHVTMTSDKDGTSGAAGGSGREGSVAQAELMLEEAVKFGIEKTISMCPVQDIAPLRERFGNALGFNAMINKKPEESDDDCYRVLDQFLAERIQVVKLWSAPRGRERGFYVNAPWRIEGVKRAAAAGVKIVMVHVGDPDLWWNTTYKETEKFGTKPDQYIPLCEMIERFPDLIWVGAHMGGNPEHPDQLQAMLEKYPKLHFDTSATKWQVREVSRHPAAIRKLIEKMPDRFLFGSDLVTRHGLVRDHYISRYWCQRTLWESDWQGLSPIADSDYRDGEGNAAIVPFRGVNLSSAVLNKVYRENAVRILT